MVAKSLREDFDSQEEYEDHLSGLSNWELEEEADRILADQRRETTRKHSEMKDYLSKGQMETRISREIYTSAGFPDESLMSGMVKRAYNPPREGGPRDLRGQ